MLPRQFVPQLRVPTLDHGEFDRARSAGPVHVTRVLPWHPLSEYERRGTSMIALSSDTPERAREMARKVGTTDLR